MKIRIMKQNEIHRGFVSMLSSTSFQRSTTAETYTLRWGIEHALVVGDQKYAKEILQKPSYVHAFDVVYPTKLLALYWGCIDQEERGESYWPTIQQCLCADKKE